MPYPRSLQRYTLPEFYAEAPEHWERRLREVSPISSGLDYLVFRRFDPTGPDGDNGWLFKERPMWALYRAKPIALIDSVRAEDFKKHWSEFATEAEQFAHKEIASSYQHFMWHSRGVYVLPFLFLQGQWGGTPAKYTKTEQAFLQGSGLETEPLPIGSLPPCPFDERVVKMITVRDRLLQCANRYDELEKRDTSAWKAAEQEAAQLLQRETYLDTCKILVEPQKDFLTHYMKRSEHRDQFPSAPPELIETTAKWKDHFLQFGNVLGASPARVRQVH